LTSCRLRPRRTGICRSRWNASISRKTSRKPSGGSASSTRCGKSRSFVRRKVSLLRRIISPNPLPLRASQQVHPRSSFWANQASGLNGRAYPCADPPKREAIRHEWKSPSVVCSEATRPPRWHLICQPECQFDQSDNEDCAEDNELSEN